jgi:hypothetical protein
MKKNKPILYALGILIASLYITMPVLNYGFWGLPIYCILLLLIFLIKPLYNSGISLAEVAQKGVPQLTKYNFKFNKFLVGGIVICILYATLLPVLTSWSLFRNQSYRNLIGKVEIGSNFKNHMTPISLDKIRVVDQDLAYNLGDKVLGAQSGLGSQVTLGEFTIQKVNDQLYWVAPLLHSGFFKWNKNRSGTPGYVMVNATNERDVKLVQQVGGKPVRIKYQSEAFFNDNLYRHIYLNGHCTEGLTDFTFEIDDKGIPYWVVTKYKKKIGFYGSDAVSVLVVNAATGVITEYPMADVPIWIDRIQPEQFIEEQLNDWGEYVHGFWNFSNENKLKITEGLTLVYGEDNKSYWYTGLTSVGSDESTVGFVLVDTRTKKAIWYKQSGATESAAQNSAMGKVQEKGYEATVPTPYNINNIPTYVMTLKDNAGLVKMYAMVAIEDYTIVGVGNTLMETLMAYRNAFNTSGNRLNTQSLSQKRTERALITRINTDVKNGNSYYYFKIQGEDKIFVGTTQISNDFPLTYVNDSIEIIFENDDEKLIGVSEFKNLSLSKLK